MDCPKCHEPLESVSVGGVQVQRCSRCAGTWYDKGELRVLKDKESHGDYRWIDFALWKDADKFRARTQQRYSCPRDGQPMTTVHYGESSIAVDICPRCEGIWLDKGEYEEIVRYLEEVVESSSVADYLGDIRDEFVELLEAREAPWSVMKDLGKILYLLQLRFVLNHPNLARAAATLPKYPGA
jgi:Zn-finger nucleic acid-binding protein